MATEQGRFSLTQLRYFCNLAETGSVTETALLHGVTPPAVSAAIGKLVKTLGRELFFHAARNRLSLTQEGKRAYQHAVQMLQSSAALLQEDSYRTHLRIGLITHLGPEWAMQILRLSNEWDHAHLEIHELDIQGVISGLNSGYLDAALMYEHGVAANVPRAYVATNHPYAVVPPGLADHQSEISLSQLQHLPLITVKPASVSALYRQICHDAGFEPLPGAPVTSVATACSLIAQGYGFTILHQRQSLPYGVKAVELVEDMSAFEFDLHLFYRDDHLPSTMQLIDEIVASLRAPHPR